MTTHHAWNHVADNICADFASTFIATFPTRAEAVVMAKSQAGLAQ
jgi:hypothetical protein